LRRPIGNEASPLWEWLPAAIIAALKCLKLKKQFTVHEKMGARFKVQGAGPENRYQIYFSAVNKSLIFSVPLWFNIFSLTPYALRPMPFPSSYP
jgi:hypothetical protein